MRTMSRKPSSSRIKSSRASPTATSTVAVKLPSNTGGQLVEGHDTGAGQAGAHTPGQTGHSTGSRRRPQSNAARLVPAPAYSFKNGATVASPAAAAANQLPLMQGTEGSLL